MSSKKLAMLGTAAVVMVLLAVYQSKISNKPVGKAGVMAPFIQGLNLAEVSKIQIAKGQDKVSFYRKGKAFVVADKDNYPADTKKVNQVIINVLDIKSRGEILTGNIRNHEELKVSDDNFESYVKFYGNENSLLTGIIFGKRLESGVSAIRLVGSDDVYTTKDSVWIQSGSMDYIETRLFGLEESSILKVSVSHNGKTAYEMTSEPGSSNIQMFNVVPQGKQLKGSDYEQVFKTLSYLSFTDVTAGANMESLKFDTVYTCYLDDSTIYTVNIASKDGKCYIKCSAKFTSDVKQITISKDESEEELKKKEAKLLAHDNSVKFNSIHAGWVYEIQSYKAENLTRKFEDLIEDIPEPVEDAN